MVTGDYRNQVDQVWNAFWSGGVSRVYPQYLARALGAINFDYSGDRAAKGRTLNKVSLAQIEIPLLPLEEQKRIAAILDQADALRCLRQRAIDRLNSLSQSIFYEMFGDPVTNPKGWPLGTIEDLTASTQYGTSGKAGSTGAFPILRMGNLSSSGKIDITDLKYIDLLPKDIEKYTVKKGDILFNRTNSPDLVGKTAVYYGDAPFAYAGYLVRLSFRIYSHVGDR